MIVPVPSRDGQTDLGRIGLLIGFSAIIVGLALGITAHVRSTGLAVAPTIAGEAVYLQAQVHIFAGCVALIVALLWIAVRSDGPPVRRLEPIVRATLAVCAASVLLRVLANWAIVTGRLPDHIALIPALADLAAAVLCALVIYSLAGRTNIGLTGRLLLHSSCWWLAAAVTGQLVWVSARVFLDNEGMLWFLERPTLEVALLGFVMLGGLGMLLSTLPVVSLNRDLIQTLLRNHQAVNALIFAWGGLQVWSLRYPGSYQGLVLAIIGIGIVICVAIIAASTGLLERWQALAGSAITEDGPRSDVVLASLAIAFMVMGATLFAMTAFLSAALRSAPRVELLLSAVLAVAVGMMTVVTVAVADRARGRSGPAVTAGTGAVVFGVTVSALLWTLTIVVERSLDVIIAAGEVLAIVGIIVLALSAVRGFPAEAPAE